MPTVRKKKTRSVNDSPVSKERKLGSLWSAHGMDDVVFQRGAQVNLWTVMGGLQTAALLTQIGIVWEKIQAGHWYLSLFIVNSLLIIVLIWAISSWESMILRWRISIPAILTQFLGNFALAVTYLLVADPAAWSLWLGISATFNWIHQLILSRLGAWETFSPELLQIRRFRFWVFGLWPILCMAGAIHMNLAPTTWVKTIWGVVGTVVIIQGLFQQHFQSERERRELGIP